MKIASVKTKLHQYIESAPKRKLNALYTLVEDEIMSYTKWNNKEVVDEFKKKKKESKMDKPTLKKIKTNK